MWGQCDELPDGGVVDEPSGAALGAAFGEVSPDAEDGTDGELVEAGVEVVELPVAALATAAPPTTRTPASATPASAYRSRIFMSFTSFLQR
jgi:hypothetical protein